MRAALTIALASVLAVAGACKSFREDVTDEPAPVDPPRPDGGTVDGAGASMLGDVFGEVSVYTRFDNFERENPLEGGPFNWEMKGVIAKEDCTAPPECSPATMLSLWVKGEAPVMITDLDNDSRVLRFDFAMRTDAHGVPISHAQLASIAISDSRNIYLEVKDGTLRLGDQKKKPDGDDGDYDNQEIDLAPHVSSAWARYRIYADFDRNLVGVWRDGAVLGVKQLRPFITAQPFEPQKIRVGAGYWDGKNEFDIYVDDVGIVDRKGE